MMSVVTLSNLQKDALKEICNIGAGNATTSLSQLIDKKIVMNVPKVKMILFDEEMNMIGEPEQIVVVMYFKIHGEATVKVYIILSVEEAESVIYDVTCGLKIDLLNNSSEERKLGLSALQEVGNIITGSYLSALSDFTNLLMKSSIPHLAIDMAGAILSIGLIELSERSDYAIFIDTQLKTTRQQNDISSQFFFLPDIDTVPILFQSLGMDSHD